MTEYDSYISNLSPYPAGRGFTKSVVTQPGAQTDPKHREAVRSDADQYVGDVKRHCERTRLVGVCAARVDVSVFAAEIEGVATIETFRAVCTDPCPNDDLPKVPIETAVEITQAN